MQITKAFAETESKIVALAKRLECPSVLFEDLAQEGRIELVRVCRNFDETRGVQLWTYAYPHIRRKMLRVRAKELRVSGPCFRKGDGRDPFETLLAAEGRETIEARDFLVVAMSGLSKGEQVILVERFSEEKPFRTIAKELGLALGAVAQIIKDARASLRAIA